MFPWEKAFVSYLYTIMVCINVLNIFNIHLKMWFLAILLHAFVVLYVASFTD